MDLVFLFFKLIFALSTVLGLMYLTFKLSGNKLSKINNNNSKSHGYTGYRQQARQFAIHNK